MALLTHLRANTWVRPYVGIMVGVLGQTHVFAHEQSEKTVAVSNKTPIEPILGKKKQEKRRLFSGKKWRHKQAAFRPVWDIVLMYASVAGAVLLPFGLVFLGWGVAAALLGLWLTGAILSAILALSLLFFYLSFRRNESTSDAWLERYSWRLAVAVVALAALAVFIGGLIGGLLVVWLPALLVFLLLAGLLTWLQLRK